MADPVAVAQAFVQHFNSLFDSADRTALAPLYVRSLLRLRLSASVSTSTALCCATLPLCGSAADQYRS